MTTETTWPTRIAAESTHEGIITVLRLFGLEEVADRLGFLRGLADDDPAETAMDVESLRAMALFLMSERQLPEPEIGITPDGLMQTEWRTPPSGILALEFLPSGLIRFAALSAPAQPGVDRLRVNGTLPKAEAMAAVRPFTSLLPST